MTRPAPYAPAVEPERRDVRRLSKKARDAIADRDAAMLRANDLGHGVRLIAADAGLKPATVARIIRRQRGESTGRLPKD